MSLNVMVVDSSAVVRAMVVKVLKMTEVPFGEIIQAADGKEGLELLADHGVDLVLVDDGIRAATGEKMIEKIRGNEAWQALPIIVISTEGSVTRIERLQQEKASFVRKPFTPVMVRKILAQVTGQTGG